MYNDKGSGANKDLSIWRPKEVNGFKRLGDVAIVGYWQPKTAFLVK